MVIFWNIFLFFLRWYTGSFEIFMVRGCYVDFIFVIWGGIIAEI